MPESKDMPVEKIQVLGENETLQQIRRKPHQLVPVDSIITVEASKPQKGRRNEDVIEGEIIGEEKDEPVKNRGGANIPPTPPEPPAPPTPEEPEEPEDTERDFVDNVKDLLDEANPEMSDEWIKTQAELVLNSFGRTPKELRRIMSEGNKLFSDGKIKKEDWIKLAGVIHGEQERLAKERKSRPEQNTRRSESSTMEDIKEILEQGQQIQEAQLRSQRDQVDLMRKGYNGVVLSVEERSAINPEMFFQSVPPWFEQLSKKEKAVVKNMLHINYIAAIKRDNAEGWLGEMKGIRLEKDALENMKRDMPGFRNAFATMQDNIFEANGSIFVIKGTKGDRAKGIAPTGGYAILESEGTLNEYKENLAKELAEFLSRDDVVQEYADNMHISIHEVATVAISNVDNLFFGTGAYDSGDKLRALSAGDSNICSEAVRVFFMPGVKGESKWLLSKTDQEIQDKREKGTGQEDFGGILGGWIRENALANRTGYVKSDGTVLDKPFREGLNDNDIELFPDRIFYSLMDHERFVNDPNLSYANKTIAEVIINTPKIEVADGILDFEGGNDAFDFSRLAATELMGDYSDTRGGALKIFKHISASKQEDLLNTDGLINALIKARKDDLVNDIFRNEDLMTACIIMTARPAGLLRGTPKMLLNIPENLYDHTVYNMTLDPRLFDGLAGDFKNRLIKRLNANDQTKSSFSPGNLFRLLIPALAGSSLVSERSKIRNEARNSSKS